MGRRWNGKVEGGEAIGAYEPDRSSLCAQAAFQASENQSHLLHFKSIK
jgi:hypothetical protein